MEDKIISFQNSIELLSKKYSEYIETTFINLDKGKKSKIVLAICRVASKLPDPTMLNIKIVAKEGKVSVGALYKYFGNRENMLNFTISVVREYIVSGMEIAEKELAQLPLEEALYYYCIGSVSWSKEEITLAYFFYQSAYCGNHDLMESLVKPITKSYFSALKLILEATLLRNEIILSEDFDYCVAYLHRSLLPIADAGVYKNIKEYYFPGGFSYENIRGYIKNIIKGISKLE